MWRNTHAFSSQEISNGAPKEKETFFLLFPEPWMAMQYIKEGLSTNTDKASITVIDSQEAWDFYRGLVLEAGGVTKALISPCLLSVESHEHSRLFVSASLESLRDFEKVSENIGSESNNPTCSECYKKEEFLNKYDGDETIMIRRREFHT